MLTIKTKSIKEIKKEIGLEKQGKLQKFVDKTVSEALQPFVSFDSGTQEKSIKSATVLGSGLIIINVPYAQFQAGGKVMIGVKSHSPWAKKDEVKMLTSKDLVYHNGAPKRGAKPFERMVKSKKNTMLKQISEYARRECGDG